VSSKHKGNQALNGKKRTSEKTRNTNFVNFNLSRISNQIHHQFQLKNQLKSLHLKLLNSNSFKDKLRKIKEFKEKHSGRKEDYEKELKYYKHKLKKLRLKGPKGPLDDSDSRDSGKERSERSEEMRKKCLIEKLTEQNSMTSLNGKDLDTIDAVYPISSNAQEIAEILLHKFNLSPSPINVHPTQTNLHSHNKSRILHSNPRIQIIGLVTLFLYLFSYLLIFIASF
jgi:hypothetical protein